MSDDLIPQAGDAIDSDTPTRKEALREEVLSHLAEERHNEINEGDRVQWGGNRIQTGIVAHTDPTGRVIIDTGHSFHSIHEGRLTKRS